MRTECTSCYWNKKESRWHVFDINLLLGHVSIVVYETPSTWHMHIYPFGAAVRGKHRPCGPQGIVIHGSKDNDSINLNWCLQNLLFGIEQLDIWIEPS
jgi:hypothetical protein